MTLRVREEQLLAFRAVADEDFVARTAEYLRAEHPEAAVALPDGERPLSEMPDELLLGMVRRGIARARSYGLTWESSITAFVVLMFVVAPNFDAHPLIRRVLTDEKVAPDLRVDQLWEETTDENWEAAAAGYDAGAWEVTADAP